jgi:hypothetical protein
MKHRPQVLHSVFFSLYSMVFIFSLNRFPSENAYPLALLFVAAFFHLKRFYAIPAFLTQCFIFPEFQLINLGFIFWLYYFIPTTCVKYTQPIIPFFISLLPLFGLSILYHHNPKIILAFLNHGMLSLWGWSFLAAHLPDGLEQWKTERYVFFLMLVYFLIAPYFFNTHSLILIPLLILLKSFFNKNLSAKIFTHLYLFFYIITTSMLGWHDLVNNMIISLISVKIILNGAKYHHATITHLRRNHSRTACALTL